MRIIHTHKAEYMLVKSGNNPFMDDVEMVMEAEIEKSETPRFMRNFVDFLKNQENCESVLRVREEMGLE